MPVTNENCECDPPIIPPDCAPALDVPVDFEPTEVKDYEIKDACVPCQDTETECLPVIPDVPPAPVCKIPDPAYQIRRAVLCDGGFNLYTPISPLEAPIRRSVPECNAVPCSPLDQDVWKEDVNEEFQWTHPDATSQFPLRFIVRPPHLDRVHCESGYVMIGQPGMYNEWVPLCDMQDAHVLQPVYVFPGSKGVMRTSDPANVLVGLDLCGTIPWIYEAPTVTNPGDQNDLQNVAITPLVISADQEIQTWNITGLPTGLTYDPNTGDLKTVEVSGTPTVIESPLVTVTATNFFGVTSEPITFTWNIT